MNGPTRLATFLSAFPVALAATFISGGTAATEVVPPAIVAVSVIWGAWWVWRGFR